MPFKSLDLYGGFGLMIARTELFSNEVKLSFVEHTGL